MTDTTNAMLATAFASGTGAAPERAPYAAEPRFDADRYWSYLEHLEATDEQKTALLEALWGLMRGFVELGFGVDPVQSLMPALVAATLAADADDVAAITASDNNKEEPSHDQ